MTLGQLASHSHMFLRGAQLVYSLGVLDQYIVQIQAVYKKIHVSSRLPLTLELVAVNSLGTFLLCAELCKT